MSSQSVAFEKWAKIPESVITGDILPGASTETRVIAVLVYSYLDLRQGANGRPVRGFRHVATKLGLQERTVSKAAKALAVEGLIDLELTTPVATSAVMTVIHNPARARVNPAVDIGDPPTKYRHGPVPYKAPLVRNAHESVQDVHKESPTPDARHAAGSRSPRSSWYAPGVVEELKPMLTDEQRCPNCLALVSSVRREAEPKEFCHCIFESVAS